MIFVDTSALIALLDQDQRRHAAAVEAFERALLDGDELVTHNYIEMETLAVVLSRYGAKGVRSLVDGVLAPIDRRWVDVRLHDAARSSFVASPSKRVSFVDLVSFEFMRRGGIQRAFAFDRDFRAQGFEVIPR